MQQESTGRSMRGAGYLSLALSGSYIYILIFVFFIKLCALFFVFLCVYFNTNFKLKHEINILHQYVNFPHTFLPKLSWVYASAILKRMPENKFGEMQ